MMKKCTFIGLVLILLTGMLQTAAAQDVDPSDWNEHTVIRPVVMLDDVGVILATFGAAGTKANLVIFLRKHGNTWKIMKVDDVQSHFWPSSRK
jgi:hypothetical protein